MENNEYSISDRGLDAFALRDALNSGKTLCGGEMFRCTIKRVETPHGDVYEMNGPTGRHAISVEQSDITRLWKHWVGYKLNTMERS